MIMTKTDLGRSGKLTYLLAVLTCLFILSIRLTALEKTLIFPIPQQIQITGDKFILDETMSIIVPLKMQ